ncbi:MAG: DUF3299 domain-containing protein [Desulfovibrionaceae bacterium]|nr:DUF3299 domain-containing protein [Desulfovibrionaceae bacterium]
MIRVLKVLLGLVALSLLGVIPLKAQDSVRELSWSELLAEKTLEVKKPLNEDELKRLQAQLSLNPLLDHKLIRIEGFVVPLERDQDGGLKSLLLVPYFGACIHVPPPPPNQIIYVELVKPEPNIHTMDSLKVEGTLVLEESLGDFKASYRLIAAKLVNSDLTSKALNLEVYGLVLLCGLSVSLGWILPVSRLKLEGPQYSFILALAAGLMLTLGFSAVIKDLTLSKIFLFAVGLLGMLFLSYFGKEQENKANPLGSNAALACAFHNLPECFLVLSTALGNFSLGIILALTMMLHNVPMGLSLGLAMGELKNLERLKYTLMAGVFPPVAVIFIYFSLRDYITLNLIRQIFPLAGGCLAFIALFHLLPDSLKLRSFKNTLGGLLLGAGIILGALLFNIF